MNITITAQSLNELRALLDSLEDDNRPPTAIGTGRHSLSLTGVRVKTTPEAPAAPAPLSIADNSSEMLARWRFQIDQLPHRNAIAGIKLIREHTGCSLKDSKDYVEANREALGL